MKHRTDSRRQEEPNRNTNGQPARRINRPDTRTDTERGVSFPQISRVFVFLYRGSHFPAVMIQVQVTLFGAFGVAQAIR